MVVTEADVVVVVVVAVMEDGVSGDDDDDDDRDISFNGLLFEAAGVRIHDIFSNPLVALLDEDEEKGVISFLPKSSSSSFLSTK
jgi:hypothetical protein